MTGPTRVVVLGGGYVGVHAYRSLVRHSRAGDLAITVVSAHDCHNFHGFTGEVVAGLLPLDVTRTPLAPILPRADFRHARIAAVDRTAGTVLIEPVDGGPATSIGYDHLIIGTGGREPVDRIPGMAEHGFTLRAPGEFERLLRRLSAVTGGDRRDPAALESGRRCEGLTDGLPVAVVGAGMAGVELAAAIADRLRACGAPNPVLLYQSGSAVLPNLRRSHPRVAARAERELARLNVQVSTRSAVARVVDGAIEFADGTRRPVAAVLATSGQRPDLPPGLEQLPRDTAGRLITDATLQVTQGIWAAGDAARVAHPRTSDPVPANALWAIKAGAALGRNVAGTAAGRQPRALRYRGLGQAMAFGIGRAATELYGIPIPGVAGWVLRLAFFLRFMPQRKRALRVVTALLSLPARGRYGLPTAEREAEGIPPIVQAAAS